MEQFQQAIAASHEIYPSEENTISRRKQFISAIKDQIKRVEMSVASNLAKEGKPTFTWVKLEEGDRDDFVSFLSSDSPSTRKPDRATEPPKEVPCKREKEVIIQIESLNGEHEVTHNCHRASSNGFSRGFEAQARVKLCKNNILRVKDEESMPRLNNSFPNHLNLKGISFTSKVLFSKKNTVPIISFHR